MRLPCVYNYCTREWISLFNLRIVQKPICYYESILVTSNIQHCLSDNFRRKMKSDTNSDNCVSNQYKNSHQYDNNNNNLESKVEKKMSHICSCIKDRGRVFVNDVQQAVTYIKSSGVCGADNGIILLQCCGDLIPNLHPNKKVELLFTMWEMLTNLGSEKENYITSDHYCAYLSSLAENRYPVSVEDVLQDMSDRGLPVDDRIYYALLRCVCEAGDMQQSAKLIVKFKDANIPVVQDVFDYIILARARAGDMKSAESVMNLLKSDSVKCDASTYIVLLKGSAELGLSEKVDFYLKQASEISPLSNSQILDIVKSLAYGNLLQYIPTVLKAGKWLDEVDHKVINTCIQLIHLGHVDAALSVITTVPQCMPSSPDSLPSHSAFFLHELISANTPAQKIIDVCKSLSKVNEYAISKATELALLSRCVDLALQLLKEMYIEGLPVRPHYFWPLIISAAKEHGEQGLMNVLDTMRRLNIRPDFETMLDYVLPHFDISDAVGTVNKFRSRGLSLVELMSPIIAALLDSLRIDDAIQLGEKYKARLDGNALARHLALAYVQTADINQIMTMLSIINTETTAGSVVHHILIQKQFPVKSEKIITLLKALKDENYSMKKFVYDTVIKFQRQYNIPKDVIPCVNITDALTSGNMTNPKDMTVDELECHLLELKAKNLNIRGVLRKLLQLHCRFSNVDRAMEIHKELLSGGCQFSAGMLSSLLQLYTSAGRVYEAEKCLVELQTKHGDFEIDSFKIVDLATVLTANAQYDRAEKVIKDTKVKVGNLDGNTRNCVNLLFSVAEKESPTATKRMFNLLIDRYCNLNNVLLGPLIRSYLFKGDLDGAVKEFEDCVETYKKTPLAYELMMNLARAAQSDNSKSKQLERIVEMCREIHTPRNADVMFAVALAECNLEKQLLILLHTPGFKLHKETLMTRCKRLVEENKPVVLLKLLLALKQNIPLQDVQHISNMILGIYDQQGDCDGALALWSQMQEHDVVITDGFKKKLATLLTNHRKPVPFKT